MPFTSQSLLKDLLKANKAAREAAERYVVAIERKGKTGLIVLRADDYAASVKTDKANNPKLRYGSGAMWNVLNVMDYNAYQNMENSKPF